MQSQFTFTTQFEFSACEDGLRDLDDDDDPSAPPSNVREDFSQLSIKKSEGFNALPLRSYFNAIAAANRLPAELVVKIFMSGAWTKWYELLSLTHICQHWRDVARGTPQLWTGAVASMFNLGIPWQTSLHSIRCLPTLLSWSEPCPLRLEMHSITSSSGQGGILPSHFKALEPHFSRLCHLTVHVFRTKDVVAVFEQACSGMSSLESLRIMGVTGALLSDDRIFLDGSALPRLHTLSVPGAFFTSAVALETLKSITLHDHPRSHDDFLAALERCALGLETLTIESLRHPHWMVEESTSLRHTVRLPSLRRLRVVILRGSSPSPDFIPGVSFPPDVVINVDRSDGQWDTHALLPKHLVGLHAPPFFDAMRLFVSGSASTVIMNCFVGGAERLSVREIMRLPTELQGFLKEYMSATVTELAVHLDPDSPPRLPQFIDGDCLSSFVWGFPNLHRLDLLGKNVRDVKLRMAKVFLDRLAESKSNTTFAPPKCLAFSFEVEERPLVADERRDRYMDEFRYTVDYQLAAVREQLDAIEALLKAHLAGGGPRLPRLELCITIVRMGPGPYTVGAPYRRVAAVPPSSHWTRKLSWFYLPRFQALVDKVVFLGHPQALIGGVRQLPVQPSVRTQNRAERGRNTRRRGR
ncbi:hypothetical protein V8D89_003746 [Ganoderma adspersum]